MADIGIVPIEYAEALRSPNVSLVELAVFVFPDGNGGTVTRRWHLGAGTLVVDGDEYYGVTDPSGARVVSIGYVELPTVQIAAKLDITIRGVDQDFVSLIMTDARLVFGSPMELFFVPIDMTTYQPKGPKFLMFDNGRCGMPTITANASGLRAITIPVDGIWATKNFAPGGRMNNADQTRRFPGDRGAELIGGPAAERIK